MSDDITLQFADKVGRINQRLDQLVEDSSSPYATLFKAARYTLFGGGKRLRPLLAIVTAESLGVDLSKILDPACALELVHTYSLVHDDLPCMDDDDFRRDRPTLHKLYPEAVAILTGDFLLTYAFEVLTEAPYLQPKQSLRLIRSLSKAAGGHGMVAGQIMDLEAEGEVVEIGALEKIHQCKTAALLSAAFEFAGIVAEVDAATLLTLHKLGESLGLAFQIIDDVLDSSSRKKEGQKKGSDVENSKNTYVTLMGIERSKRRAYKLLEESYQFIETLPCVSHKLRLLAKHLVVRGC